MKIPDHTARLKVFTEYLDAGICALPAIVTEKRPAIGSWKSYQNHLPTQAEAAGWNQTYDAVCIICGAVSGGVEMIDFDHGAEWCDPWAALVEAECPGLLSRLVVEKSQRDGRHVVYRAPEIPGNMKLARRATDGATMIETRGEGGLFLCAPSPGYEMLQGDIVNLPTITITERQALIDAAESLNEVFTEPEPSPVSASQPTSQRPGDDFNVRGDPTDAPRRHGWVLEKDGPNQMWRRPGKAHGTSATLKSRCFYVHSSNAAPFEAGKGYAPFAVFTLLNHNGDYAAASADLRRQGFGSGDDGASAKGSTRQAANYVADAAKPAAELLEAVDACQLMAEFPELRPPVIHGFLREGETCNLISMPKVGKTHLGIDLALAVVTGRMWLDVFPVESGRVLYIDCELHRDTFSKRLQAVTEARGIGPDQFRGRLDIFSLRGRLQDIYTLAPYFSRIRRGQYKIIVLDALYRLLPPDCEENSNSDMAPIYNTVDRYADRNGSAFVIVHHTSKGSQAGKSITDVGAGASSAARATDSHIILREHERPDCIVLEAACRSWPAPTPIVLRKQYPLWILAPELDPADLKQPGSKRSKEADVEPEPADATPIWNASTFAGAFVGPQAVEKATIIDQAREQGLTKAHAETCIRLGLSSGKIHRWKVRPSLAVFLASEPQPEPSLSHPEANTP